MTKRILVCDDTVSLLDLFETYLRDDAGYETLRADTLAVAEHLYSRIEFDLVISDDLNGGGVAWLQQINREDLQPVLNTSAAVGIPNLPTLPKSFKHHELIEKVRELIGPPDSG